MANRISTIELRARAVELSCLSAKIVIEVARDLVVNPKTLHSWRHLARQNGTVPTDSTSPKRSEVAQELRELRKQV